MANFTERSAVEDRVIEALTNNGWTFAPAESLDVERESLEEPLLTPRLVRALRQLNDGISDDEIQQVVNELKSRASSPDGIKQILNYLKTGIPLKLERDQVLRYIKLIEYSELSRNEFLVTRQMRYRRGDQEIRVDVILYVNGIPLVVIECKSATSLSADWLSGYNQIKEYEKKIPELFKYVQVGISAEAAVRYFPIVPWQDPISVEEWKTEGIEDPLDATLTMLYPSIILDIIKYFIFYQTTGRDATKVITRYMQYRAVNRMVDRAVRYVQGVDTKRRGLIWHWQGSGKTLEMIFGANKLFDNPKLGKPTIFFVVDRVDLEEQLYKDYAGLDINQPEVIGSIPELRRTIQFDDYRGKRSLMITLVHKFRQDQFKELNAELEKLSSVQETISTRRNVIAFVDEGHRSQFGTLGAQMRQKILKSSVIFALTGTPLKKRGRDTFVEFSYPGEENYLDPYTIGNSITDGFTVKIAYQARLERQVHLRKDLLEAFLSGEFEELPEEVREDVKAGVKKRLNETKLFLEDPVRIKKVCADIKVHFENEVNGRFKGMVVAASRHACVLYKEELDKVLPKEYTEIVMSEEGAKSSKVQEYFIKLQQRFKGKDLDTIRREITDSFLDENQNPKLLIVTDMLLTGFNAPVLQTMYLDKPLKEHRLLQAIARTNRPYKRIKEAGLIIDYVGLLGDIEKAFEGYANEDIKGVLLTPDELTNEFTDLLRDTLAMFEGIPRKISGRDSLLKAIQVLTAGEQKSEEFLESVRRLRRLFEFLGASAVKVDMLEDFKWLTAIYVYYTRVVLREGKRDPDVYVAKYLEKTIKYVHETTEIQDFTRDLPVFEFDDKYLVKVEAKLKSKEEKAANIVFTLSNYVLVDKAASPIFESLVEKVQRLVEKWKAKNRDFEKIYAEGVEIIKETQKLRQRQKELGVDDAKFAVILAMEKLLASGSSPSSPSTFKRLQADLGPLFTSLDSIIFPGWQTQRTTNKEVELEIRRFLRKYVARKELSYDSLDEATSRLLTAVKSYSR